MAHIVTDKVIETTTTTGTGAIAWVVRSSVSKTSTRRWRTRIPRSTHQRDLRGFSGGVGSWPRNLEHGQHPQPDHRCPLVECELGGHPERGDQGSST